MSEKKRKPLGLFPVPRKEVLLEFLVGKHVLSGYDETLESPQTISHIEPNGYEWEENIDERNVVKFILDNVTYKVFEDPSDGYRSSMDKIERCYEPVKNRFPGVSVICKMKLRPDDEFFHDEDDYILEMTDEITGKVVLRVGTDNGDSYYPYFVNEWHPENMVTNIGR